jgi:TonB family protein
VAPAPPPTPTAAEIAAERLAQDEKMRELAAGLVAEMMAQKEEEIRAELIARQEKIDELQKRLTESEKRAQQGQLTGEDVRNREELQRQIAAEEETQRQQEAELEAERLQAETDAQLQAMAHQTATAAVEATTLAATTVMTSTPTLPPTPTSVPTTVPTEAPTPALQATVVADRMVEENRFVNPNEVDSPPAILKKSPVVWSRTALSSKRKGVVVLQATVNSKGLVEDVKVLRSDHEGFGIPQAVTNAVMKYRFKPGIKDGVPVKTYFSFSARYDFTNR